MTNVLFDRGELRTVTYSQDATRRYWSGRDWQLGTASYWESVANGTPTPETYRLGGTLNEEIAACLLGGHGMTWDLVSPYLDRVRGSGILEGELPPSSNDLRALLLEPVVVKAGYGGTGFRTSALSVSRGRSSTPHYRRQLGRRGAAR